MFRSVALATVALVASFALAENSEAREYTAKVVPGSGYVQPDFYPAPLPKLGFQTYLIHGYGKKVTYVFPGSLADRMGLECGDIVVSLNGSHLGYPGAWQNAMRVAVMNGGYVNLGIRDVRTGRIVYRNTYVGGITYRSMP